MSYIFSNFEGTRTFSNVVAEAKEAGYTEPDPRDDLSGTDVARKVDTGLLWLEFQWLLSLKRGWHLGWGNFLVFFIHKLKSHTIPREVGYIYIVAAS